MAQPARTPVQRFAGGLATAGAWLGAVVGRYSFDVALFHLLLHAVLSRRYRNPPFTHPICYGRRFVRRGLRSGLVPECEPRGGRPGPPPVRRARARTAARRRPPPTRRARLQPAGSR